MAYNKTISIDAELVEHVEGIKNFSKHVNQLLRDDMEKHSKQDQDAAMGEIVSIGHSQEYRMYKSVWSTKGLDLPPAEYLRLIEAKEIKQRMKEVLALQREAINEQ